MVTLALTLTSSMIHAYNTMYGSIISFTAVSGLVAEGQESAPIFLS
jgi:hypothetical protein